MVTRFLDMRRCFNFDLLWGRAAGTWGTRNTEDGAPTIPMRPIAHKVDFRTHT